MISSRLVVKGRSRPTQPRTLVSGVPNMRFDRNFSFNLFSTGKMARRRVTSQSIAEQHAISGTDQTVMLDAKYINPTKGKCVSVVSVNWYLVLKISAWDIYITCVIGELRIVFYRLHHVANMGNTFFFY